MSSRFSSEAEFMETNWVLDESVQNHDNQSEAVLKALFNFWLSFIIKDQPKWTAFFLKSGEKWSSLNMFFLCNIARRSEVKLSVFLSVCVVLGATSHVCTY